MKRFSTRLFSSLIVIGMALVTVGCAARSTLEPLGKGNRSIHTSLGGPIVAAFGTHVPVPYAVLAVESGISEKINTGVDLHILSLFYEVFGVDAGAMWYPLTQQGIIPTVGIGGKLMLMGSFKSTVSDRLRAYPIASATACWKNDRLRYYLGSDLTIPFTRLDYDPEVQTAILSPFFGCQWASKGGYFIGLELKWQGANLESDKTAVDYTAIGRYGALAPLFTIGRTL